jgi:16S rRNA (cytosine967-C5)-methyltransferase
MNTPAPRRAHVQRALGLLEAIQRGQSPADQQLEALFRRHPEMGKRDRAAVSGMVYGVLRDAGRLQALAGEAPAGWLARYWADAGLPAETLTALGLPPAVADASVPEAAALNLPADWHARLLRQLGADDTAALATALNQPAPVDVRVNSLRASRDATLVALQAEGLEARATPFSSDGIRLGQRLPRGHVRFADGTLEPQDEGSQLLAALAAATPGDTVIDWCAGAGGKSLAMAAHMQNRGRIVACDISASRLAKIPSRAARAGVSIIDTLPLGSGLPPPSGADIVLVDAPCSGTGTLRRAPELRLKPVDWPALTTLQARILQQAAAHLRPGGRLIYATCSLMAEENEAVVAGFLAAHPTFVPLPAPPQWPAALFRPDGALRLWPHRHGTDGFFAQAMLRLG